MGCNILEFVWYLVIGYAVVINIIAVAVTVFDKHAAKKHNRRVPEKTLLVLAALSGCVVMYITMHLAHHKTRKKKFMIGIPVIFIAELLAAFAVWYFCCG